MLAKLLLVLSYDEDLAAEQHNVLNGLLLRQQLAQPGAVRAQLNTGTTNLDK